jgi:hypothetical protein
MRQTPGEMTASALTSAVRRPGMVATIAGAAMACLVGATDARAAMCDKDGTVSAVSPSSFMQIEWAFPDAFMQFPNLEHVGTVCGHALSEGRLAYVGGAIVSVRGSNYAVIAPWLDMTKAVHMIKPD